MLRNSFHLDMNVSEESLTQVLNSRCSADVIHPELTEEKNINKPESYNRFRDLEAKQAFRQKMIDEFSKVLLENGLENEHDQMINQFKKLAKKIDKNGAIIFGKLIQSERFQKLIDVYTHKLSNDGSKSWIHSYINFGNHPDFLKNADFNDAFMHPLLISLIAYSAGGAIRMVDARGKDAEPLAVQAQDNMLHIDNTPFRKEYKIILTWERGKPSGPKGQNFVFIPGTHKGVRNCHISSSGTAWSTEDGSIFISKEAVQSVFDLQEKILPGKSPSVVEATHPDMPLTTVFEAGALVHHRYRTQEKDVPRSCIIVAFHRAQDNPGQFLSPDYLKQLTKADELLPLMMGKHSDNTDELFIHALFSNFKKIVDKMKELNSDVSEAAKIVSFSTKKLDNAELEKWKSTVTCAPKIDEIKARKNYFHMGEALTPQLLTSMMAYDKHGPLDLILYADGHEEIRKWARNRIREMPMTKLENRVLSIFEWGWITHFDLDQVLTTDALKKISQELIQFIDEIPIQIKSQANLDKQEKIAKEDAYKSIRQLIDDLGEAIVRCSSRQAFLSTSLFLFWSCDEVSRLLFGDEKTPNSQLQNFGQQLLMNYITTYLAIEMKLQFDKKAVKSMEKTTSLSEVGLSKKNFFLDMGALQDQAPDVEIPKNVGSLSQ